MPIEGFMSPSIYSTITITSAAVESLQLARQGTLGPLELSTTISDEIRNGKL